MDTLDEDDSSSGFESDDSAEIQQMIASYQKHQQQQKSPVASNKGNKKAGRKKNIKKSPKKQPHNQSLDHLKQHISQLMAIFEKHGWFIPPAESLGEKGKVWSSRIYGADKKRHRKQTERLLLEDRILQLEYCLKEQHGISEWG